MKSKQNSRVMWIVIALASCSLALIALAGQVVSAQPLAQGLNPPFTFAERPYALQAETPPPGSTVLMTETFGPGFTATTDLQGNTPLWRVAVNSDDTAGYYWNRVGSGAFINSAWSAARPIASAPMLNPGVSTYPAGQDSWLIYGPIDLGGFAYAHLSFEYYLNSRQGDTLLWGYSTDGQTFYGNSQSGPLGKWITNTLAFDTKTTEFKTVYFAFAFNSHTNPQGTGPFVRNVRLTGEPLQQVYLPFVMNNYALPPLFGPYTFDVGSTDITHWGGPFYNTGTTKYGQCVTGQCTIHTTTPHGNPGNSVRLYTNGTYSFIASSPNDIAPDNFDLYVDISPWVIYPRYAGCNPYCPGDDLGDWYGIIFNASNDTFGANPSQFAYNKTYYRLFFYNIDATKPIAIRLDRCNGGSGAGSNSCHTLGISSLPGNFIGNAGGFDTVHIQRSASGSIQVSLNGTLLISVMDATYTGSAHGKYGVFIFSSSNNATQYPSGYEMQVDFDNIKVYQR